MRRFVSSLAPAASAAGNGSRPHPRHMTCARAPLRGTHRECCVIRREPPGCGHRCLKFGGALPLRTHVSADPLGGGSGDGGMDVLAAPEGSVMPAQCALCVYLRAVSDVGRNTAAPNAVATVRAGPEGVTRCVAVDWLLWAAGARRSMSVSAKMLKYTARSKVPP